MTDLVQSSPVPAIRTPARLEPVGHFPRARLTRIPVTDASVPFGKLSRYMAPAGATVAEIAAGLDLPLEFWTDDDIGLATIIVCDAHEREVERFDLERRLWHVWRPRVDRGLRTHVVFSIDLQGGGSGGHKSPLAIVTLVAMLAFAVAAPWLAGQLWIGMGMTGAAPAAFIGAVRVAGSIAGLMALQALTKPPQQPDFGQPPATLAAKTSSIQFNQAQPGAPMKAVLGTMRDAPQNLCEALIDIDGDDRVWECVFGYAGPHRITGPQLGGVTPPNDFKWQVRQGFTSDDLQTLVTRYAHTDVLNITMKNFDIERISPLLESWWLLDKQGAPEQSMGRWDTVLLRQSANPDAPVDEHWVFLNFGQGLSYIDGSSVALYKPFRLRARKKRTDGTYGPWRNFPELFFVHWRQGQVTFALKIFWKRMPKAPPRPPQVTRSAYSGSRGGVWAYTSVKANPQSRPATNGWAADPYFVNPNPKKTSRAYTYDTFSLSDIRNVGGYLDRFEIYLDPADWGLSDYELQIMAGLEDGVDKFFWQSHVWSPKHVGGLPGGVQAVDVFAYYNPKGGAAGAPSAETGEDTVGPANSRKGNDFGQIVLHSSVQTIGSVAIERVSAVVNRQPSPDLEVCAIAVQARNVGDLGAFTVQAQHLINPLKAGDWTKKDSDRTTSSNPAEQARAVLVGDMNARPVPLEGLNDDDFADFWQRCSDQDYQCNAVISGMAIPNLFKLITGCGFGGPRLGPTLGIVQDRDRSAEGVTDTLSPRNLQNFRMRKAFAVLPDGFRVFWQDKLSNYSERSKLVYTGSKRDLLEEMRYQGLVTEDEATRRALFDLKHPRLRSTFYSFTIGARYLRFTKGDIIGLQHDILARKVGYGLVLSKQLNAAGKISFLTLDGTLPDFGGIYSSSGTIPNAPPVSFGISIEHLDGEVTLHPVTRVGPTRLQLTTVINDDVDIAAGAHVTCGPIGEEFTRLIVAEIVPKANGTADVVCFDEAPGLFTS